MHPAIATSRLRLASYSAWPRAARAFSAAQLRRPYSVSAAAHDSASRPLRMAVIGSGPAGFYTAFRVMAKVAPTAVDMYESLPVPFGLVRFGVAPDHPEVKNCQDKFEEVAQSPGFRFLGNVSVGHPGIHNPDGGSVPLEVLARHYDAIVFAYGASRDRLLGVPGENLRGVYAARDFVGWYNGLPGEDSSLYSNISSDLANAETAVVIGQGNVALDVARMLLERVDVLKQTDISEAATDALVHSRVKRVHVVGRRGPMQAAFTIKEVRELMKLPNVGFHGVDSSLMPPNLKELPRAQKRLMEVVIKGSTVSPDQADKSWSLDFCLAPKQFSGDGSQVTTATFERTRLNSPFERSAQAEHTGELVDISTSLVFRSIGYRSEALAGFEDLGIPFDDRRGVILNDGLGRVLREARNQDGAMSTEPYPGLYCAGWVKRGPTGVIASTMDDAFATADVIVRDWESKSAFLNAGADTKAGWEGVQSEVDTSGTRVVSWQDWKRIDSAEQEKGKQLGKPRSKIMKPADMLSVLS